MLTDVELFYSGILIIAAIQAGFTVWYYFRRLSIEERKVDIEAKKLAARNGGTK